MCIFGEKIHAMYMIKNLISLRDEVLSQINKKKNNENHNERK